MILTTKVGTADVEDTTHTSVPSYTPAQLITFGNWIYDEIEDALSQRKSQESSWMQSMRDYEALPRYTQVNIPIEDAPNIVVPLCAIASESIYSIAVDLIFSTNPTLTIRSKNILYQKALQELVNKLGFSADVNFQPAVEHAILDVVNLGTSGFYVPWIEATKKTDINRVKYFGPRIYAVAPEDFLTRGGSSGEDIEILPWFAYRTYPTEHELQVKAKKLNLDLTGVGAVGNVDQVRQTRESLARAGQSGNRMQKIYENYDFYCTYDIDEDGEFEDMLVFYDRTSRKIMKVQFNPYERRPFRKMCYQIRAHQFYGMGVPEMLHYFQEEISTVHNHRTLNMILANTRMWKAKHGTLSSGNMHVWPNRVVEMSDTNDLEELKLSDTYASEPMAEAADLSLAERRVGSELPMPKPSQLMSSRTPATTTMSMLQQINRRFTPAFNQMRNAAAGAMKQCLFRIQEQLLAANVDVQRWITELIGPEMGREAILALTDPHFDDEIACELTASSVTVNRDSERQEWLMLVDRLSLYYEKILQLVSIATAVETPPPVAMVARQIAEKSAEVIDRVLRTFDSVRNPADLIVKIEDEIDQGMQTNQMMQLIPVLGQMMNGGDPNATPGAEGETPPDDGGGEMVQ